MSMLDRDLLEEFIARVCDRYEAFELVELLGLSSDQILRAWPSKAMGNHELLVSVGFIADEEDEEEPEEAE